MSAVALAAYLLSGGGCATPDPNSVEGLMQSLRQGDSERRLAAVYGLKEYGIQAKPALALLTESLQDKDAAVRVGAAYAVAAIGPDADSALPRLIECLKSKDSELRLAACYAVPVVGAKSNAAVSAIQAATRDSDARVRAAASTGLRELRLAVQFQQATVPAEVASK